MGLVHRRWPRYARPWLFAGLLAFGGGLLVHGLGAAFDVSLQTGNVFLLVTLPWDADAVAWASVIEAGAGVVLLAAALVLGTEGKKALARATEASGWSRPRFRIYPATFLLGLFLLYFGLAFLFDASVYGDDVPGGFAAFVYLDYAGLLHRPMVSLVGAAVALTGFTLVTRLCWEAGLGERGDWTPYIAPDVSASPATSAP